MLDPAPDPSRRPRPGALRERGAPRRRGLLRAVLASPGGVLVSALAVVAVAAPVLAPYSPSRQVDSAVSGYRPPGTVLSVVELTGGRTLLAERVRRTADGLEVVRLDEDTPEFFPAREIANLTPDGVDRRRVFLLGSDRYGRDLLSRMLFGARVSLAVAGLAVALALTVGLLVGSAAATGPRALDAVLMRMVDGLLAFPWLFLVLMLTALFRPSLTLVVVILGATSWMGISRLVRAEILSLKRREFILAARGLGLHPARVLLRHLLPNALNPVMVQATLAVGEVILAESALSFLGMGVQPPTPSWGNMVADGQPVLVTAWWVATFPGLAIVVAVLGFNLLGDRLRDVLDPRTPVDRA